MKLYINAGIFQVGWLLSVFYGNRAALPVTVVTCVVYFLFYLRDRHELVLIGKIVCCGIIGDLILGLSGFLDYPAKLLTPPYWMVTLWLLFASTIPWSLNRLVNHRHWFLPLCVVAGPLSYYLGVSQSAVSFGYSTTTSMLALGVVWGIYGLLIHHFYQQWQTQPQG